MSQSIDERVVEMRFNNQQFEKGINETLNSVKKLKGGLNFDDASKSLSGLEKAGKSFSLGNMADSVSSIAGRFSTLGIVGMTAIQNITNTAMNAGKRIVSALTIDPIKMGFSSYETKMTAIQTVMSGTGETIDQVTKSLNDLNNYSDKTKYSFQDMTENITKFTNAGLSSQKAATAIKGISNVAAISGASAEEASRAMYNLGQALAQGSVRLMDWKSIENANMATVGFKTQLLDAAVAAGTLKKGVSGLYTTMKGTPISATHMFDQSLEEQWLTTKVLTDTLGNYASETTKVGKAANLAATQIKTVSSLIDTIEDSVKTGWAKTWENIIGNKDEATALLSKVNDVFGGMLSQSSNARNALLKTWNEGGGRYAIIEALFNAFKGLEEILAPIKEAFKEVFPPMTGQTLIAISEAIRDVTRNFKVSDETANNIKNTFKGLFSIIDIGKQIFKAFASVIFGLIPVLEPVGSLLLSLTGNIGKMITGLDNAIKKSGVFSIAIQKIYLAVGVVSACLKVVADAIIKVFDSIGSVNIGPVKGFSDNVQKVLAPISKFLEKLEAGFKVIANVVKTVAIIIGTAFKSAFDSLNKSFADTSIGMETILDVLNIGTLTAIIVGVRKFIGFISSLKKSGKEFMESVTGVLDGVKGSLEAYQNNLKANVLIKIAAAIAILAGSLVLLSQINMDNLGPALAGITTLFAELFGSMAGLSKIMAGSGFVAVTKTTVAMLGMSTAVLILSVAMKKMSELDWGGIAKGSAALVILSGVIILIAKLMSGNNAGIIKGAASFILFSIGVASLAKGLERLTVVVDQLGSIQSGKMTKGLIGIGVLLAEILAFTRLSGEKMNVKQGLGMLAFAYSLSTLADVVSKFAKMNIGSIIKSLSTMGVLLAEIALFMRISGDSKNTIAESIALGLMAQALLMFVGVIEVMAHIPLGTIASGLLAMGATLAVIAGAMNIMPTTGMLKNAAALLIISNALVVLSGTLLVMGLLPMSVISKGILTMAAALTVMAVTMKYMSTSLSGAAAIVVAVGAITLLIPALVILGSLPMSTIAVGLIAIAGTFAVLALGARLLASATPVLLGLSGSVALLGVGCLAAGVGITALAIGLAALAATGAASAAAITMIFTAILGLIPIALSALTVGIVDVIKILGSCSPIIGRAITKVLIALGDVIINTIPKAMQVLTVFVEAVLKFLVNIIPKLVVAGSKIITGILKGISDHIVEITKLFIDIIVKVAEVIKEELPIIVDAAFKLVIGFINGLATAIDKNHQNLYNACAHLIKSIVSAIVDLLPTLVSLGGDIVSMILKGMLGVYKAIITAGGNIVKGLVSGIKDTLHLAGEVIGDVGRTIINAFKSLLGIHSPSKVFYNFGGNITDGLVAGIKNGINWVKNVTGDLGNAIKDKFSGILKAMGIMSKNSDPDLGKQVGDSTTESIKASTPKAVAATKNMNKKIVAASTAGLVTAKTAIDKTMKASGETTSNVLNDTTKTLKETTKKAQNESIASTMASTIKKHTPKAVSATKDLTSKIKKAGEAGITSAKKAMDKALNKNTTTKSASKIKQTYGLDVVDQMKKAVKAAKTTTTKAPKLPDTSNLPNTKASKSKKSGSTGNTALDKAMSDIDDKKYYDKLTLPQELAAYQKLQKQYKAGSDERKRIDKEVYRVQKEIQQKTYDDAKNSIDDKKFYNKMNLDQELAADQKIEKTQKLTADQKREMDKAIYTVKQDQIKAASDKEKDAYDNTIKDIENQKYYSKLSLEQELARYQDIQKTYKLDADEKEDIEKKIYDTKKSLTEKAAQDVQDAYDKEVDLIEDKKNLEQLSVGQELRAYQMLRTKYKSNADITKKIDKQIYDTKKDLNDKKKTLDDDYYSKTKDINDKLKEDIKSANDDYDKEIKSRTDSIYSAYGLFDKLDDSDTTPVAGKDLLSNLKDQVKQIETWKNTIQELQRKGVDAGLVTELEQLGPKSEMQLQALNKLSDSDLTEYVSLWKTKSGDAKNQALRELDDLRVQTNEKILSLQDQADTDVSKLTKTWTDGIDALTKGTGESIDDLLNNVPDDVETMTKKVGTSLTKVAKTVSDTFDKSKFVEVGSNIVLGMISGMQGETPSFGIAVGDLLRNALTNLPDATPTIKPVVDMSDVQNGIASTFANTPGINVSTSASMANSISSRSPAWNDSSSVNNVDNSSSPTIQIINHYQVRNDSDISKINTGINKTLDRVRFSRGVVVTDQ